MSLYQWLSENPAAFVFITGLLGLIFGSFLNVVIHRLPIMMQREWRVACEEILVEQGCTVSGAPAPAGRYDLVVPGSACPHCGHAIGALENIPLVSWLVLRGRCRACKAPISARYPLVELLTGLVFAGTAWHFGFGTLTAAALVLACMLIAMSFIDVDHQLLPDQLTLPLIWLGLLLNLNGMIVSIQDAVIGAVAGYLALWSVYWLFKLLTGKEGMGAGDFKLLAALGAWLGWQMLPLIIMLSSLVGAVVGIALILVNRGDRNLRIPFGPYLAVAGYVALLWGRDLVDAYLSTMGLAH
ncbi:MAG: prepilin peptidase [Gammaproteobacteria bacterium]|nr:prepilin peptidase [Gammaproteobacteria bacterium]